MAKTITLNASLTWPDVKNDFVLRYEGHAIGGIRLDENIWAWHITIPMAMPAWASGTTDSLEEFKESLRGSLGKALE